MVLQARDYNFISLANVLPAKGLGHQVYSLSGAPHVDQLMVFSGVDELTGLASRRLVVISGQLTERMHAPMDIGIHGSIVADQGINHRLRLLTGGSVVQINQGLAIDRLLQ